MHESDLDERGGLPTFLVEERNRPLGLCLREGVMEQSYPTTSGNLAMQQEFEEEPRTASRPAPSHLRALPSLPEAPDHAHELGLPERFVEDLALKTLYRITVPSPVGVANSMRVSPGVAREALDELRRQRLVETTSASGRLETEWQYRLTELGMREAESAFGRSKYVGPVPVPIQDYFKVLERDTEVGAPDPVRLARALQQLVLARDVVAKVCLALTSGRPAMLWGAPGNGKTTILELTSEAIQGVTLMPMAVYVSGHIIRLYDDLVNQRRSNCEVASAVSSATKTWTFPTTRRLAITRRRLT